MTPPPPHHHYPQPRGTVCVTEYRRAVERFEKGEPESRWRPHPQRVLQGTDAENVAYLQCELGLAHQNGSFGFAVDHEKASNCFRKALDLGHCRAGRLLGELALEKLDFDLAVSAFKQALEPCNCWTEGSCSWHANFEPHNLDDHRVGSVTPSLELALAYEYSDLGEW